jgi:hypothetical protein
VGHLEFRGWRVSSIPGLDATYSIDDWSRDGKSLYITPNSPAQADGRVMVADIHTGKMQLWKSFAREGERINGGFGAMQFSKDGAAYTYLYGQTASEAYVVRGLR